MPTCFLIVVCIAIVVGSCVYIAMMNHEWWHKKPDEEEEGHKK